MENQPVYKGQVINYKITGYGQGSSGVGKFDGFTIFTPYAVPGETVEVRIIQVKKTYAQGKLMKVIEPHSDRTHPSCPIFYECGGCQSQHISYQAQRNAKRQHVKDCMVRIGGFEEVDVHSVLGMDVPWLYRNKVAVPFGVREGEIIAGFYATRSHDIIDMDDCSIQHPEINRVIAAVKASVKELNISVYDEKKHQGILRHVVVRIGVNTGEVMVVFVTNGNLFPRAEEVVAQLCADFPSIQSVIQNINTKRTNVILGPTNRLLYGRDVIYDTIGSLRFAISPHSFFQVNAPQTKVLYDVVSRYAGLTGKEVVLDAYCGIGTISLYLALGAKRVYGVEIVQEAIADAKKNALLNQLSNTCFAAGPADQLMGQWYKEGIRPDVIVVDPPRKGCEPGVLEMMIEMKPQRLIYVSCNPATLARDARILADNGFDMIEIQPVDMFPQTEHIECVVLFDRNERYN